MTEPLTAWTIAISNLETRLRVGIWDHEREHQPVRVTLSMSASARRAPHAPGGCLDYQPIVKWITEEWPRQAHTPLLETRLRELMGFVFRFDARIDTLEAALSKPLACPQARGVGVRMALTRAEHAELFGPLAAARECL